MSKFDLTAFEWCELVFQGRNKKYGAYDLRENSSKRHRKSIIIISLLAIVGFSLPKLIELARPKYVEKNIEVTELTNLKKDVESKQDLKKPLPTTPPPPVKSSIKFTAPKITKDDEVQDDEEFKSQEDMSKTKVAISIADVVGNDEKNGELVEDIKTAVTEEEKPYDVVEQMPTYPGGDLELMKFLSNNVKYPVIALENGIEGRVIVHFVVNKDGVVDRAEIVKSLDPACDREALRVVKLMPKWIPGRQNGQNVAVWFTLPVIFKIQ